MFHPQAHSGWSRLGALLLAFLFLVPGVSCSSSAAKKEDRKPVHPVRGQLFVQDKPAVGAFVLLVPVIEPAEPKDPRPRATVEPDGSFKVSTYGEHDGAPAGDYLLTVTWQGGFSSDGKEEPEDKLLGRYADPAKSKLRVTIKEGPNELPAYRLR